MKKYLVLLLLAVLPASLSAQVDRREVRSGNRAFEKGRFPDAELDYRKALNLDSTSVVANYNLASALYRKGEYESAAKFVSKVAGEDRDSRVWFNEGDIALQRQDYSAAAEAFKQAMLLDPDDRDAKDNYTYARLMMKNNGGGSGQDQQQDQKNNQDQNQNQDQQQQQNQDQDRDGNQNQGGESPSQMTQDQAEQLLQAIRAKEEKTQEKVNKEKALAVKSRQKEKNW